MKKKINLVSILCMILSFSIITVHGHNFGTLGIAGILAPKFLIENEINFKIIGNSEERSYSGGLIFLFGFFLLVVSTFIKKQNLKKRLNIISIVIIYISIFIVVNDFPNNVNEKIPLLFSIPFLISSIYFLYINFKNPSK